MELIDLELPFPRRHYPARLVDASGLAKPEQVLGLLQGNLLFPLRTAAQADERPLDRQDSLVVQDPHADAPAHVMGNIPLADAVRLHRLRLVTIVLYEELPFGLNLHYIKNLDIFRPAAMPSRISVEDISMRGAFRLSMR